MVHPDRINAADFLSPCTAGAGSRLARDGCLGDIASMQRQGFSADDDGRISRIAGLDGPPVSSWQAQQDSGLGVAVAQASWILPADWLELTEDFGKLFSSVPGRCEHVDELRGHRRGSRFHLRRRAYELMPPTLAGLSCDKRRTDPAEGPPKPRARGGIHHRDLIKLLRIG